MAVAVDSTVVEGEEADTVVVAVEEDMGVEVAAAVSEVVDEGVEEASKTMALQNMLLVRRMRPPCDGKGIVNALHLEFTLHQLHIWNVHIVCLAS